MENNLFTLLWVARQRAISRNLRKRPIAQYLKTKTIFDYTLSTKKNWRWFLYEGKSRSGSNRFR
ncbi:hypothetical protein, partial [Enterococcus italicus]